MMGSIGLGYYIVTVMVVLIVNLEVGPDRSVGGIASELLLSRGVSITLGESKVL
ncbi:hypothetical protein L873DRAFT_1798289 [Choiromyces venosus 120613-1]|uniref:Uncharacterized protein n=1 Tax=Choiromyces venosus 120613-1 TaxID=1336337 RepID=A0A3N4KHE7_9PEZI|nr:hypothetical protein L873DRAFT_1798289 [Choiromyces venosus 120613-1]